MPLNKRDFNIARPDELKIRIELRALIQQKLRPYGALGFFEPLIFHYAQCQKTVPPKLKYPALLIFAGDHGCARHLSFSEGYDTASLILENLQGDSILQALNKISRFKVKIIDAGVNYSFEGNFSYWLNHGNKLISAKIGEGTADFTQYPALTSAEAQDAFNLGVRLVNREHHYACNFLAFAGLGKGSSASALAICAAALDCKPEALAKKDESAEGLEMASIIALSETALKKHPKTHDAFTILTLFGGYEIAALTGAMLRAAELQINFMVDNLPAAAALLLARQINDQVGQYAVLAASADIKLMEIIQKSCELRTILDYKQEFQPGVSSAMAFPLLRNALKLLQHSSGSE